MWINPPALFWYPIAAIVAIDQFFPQGEFTEPWIGAGLVILGIGVAMAGRRQFQRVGTGVRTFGRWFGRRREPELSTRGIP